jgi:signal peptide peptidase SppA
MMKPTTPSATTTDREMMMTTKRRGLLSTALTRMNNRDTLIGAPYISAMLVPLMQDAETVESPDAVAQQVMEDVRGAYGFPEQAAATRKPFVYHDGIAIIPVHGILLNRFAYSWGFVTGYNFVRGQMNAALEDDDVTMIVYDVDSPGGEAVGCFELAEEMRASRDVKPSLAVVDSLAASGGYALASAATRMVCTPSGSVGSIGVYILHLNMKGALDQMGIEATYIEAGEWKTAGNSLEPRSDEVKADLQKSVDKRWGEFIDLVAANRGLSATAVRDTQARVFRADEALALGLIDDVQSPAEAVSSFLAELGQDDSEDREDDQMATEQKPETISADDRAKIASDAAAAAQTRIGTILQSPEAVGRTDLANHLAFNTQVSADDAIATMKVSPKAEAEKPADDKDEKPAGDKPGTAPQGGDNDSSPGKTGDSDADDETGKGEAKGGSRFEQAMGKDGGAGLGGAGGDEPKGEQAERSARIAAITGAQAASTGIKHRKVGADA